jgi:hypothetical protein
VAKKEQFDQLIANFRKHCTNCQRMEEGFAQSAFCHCNEIFMIRTELSRLSQENAKLSEAIKSKDMQNGMSGPANGALENGTENSLISSNGPTPQPTLAAEPLAQSAPPSAPINAEPHIPHEIGAAGRKRTAEDDGGEATAAKRHSHRRFHNLFNFPSICIKQLPV